MIGVNLFGLRQLLKADRSGTLQKLRDIGIEAVEPLVPLGKNKLSALSHELEEYRALGFSIPSVHISPSLFGRKPEIISRDLLKIQDLTGISVFVFSGMFSKKKAAQKWGNLLGETARATNSSGITVLYHNHTMEFAEVSDSGKAALDCFFDAAGPDVLLQLDIGWAGIAGDELAAERKYADRIAEIHCKDFFEGAKGNYSVFTMPKTMFAPIGEGVMKTKEVLSHRGELPNFNGAVLIDQDHSAGNMLHDIEIGFRNLKEILP